MIRTELRAVEFSLYETGRERRVMQTEARHDERHGWLVVPGGSVSICEPVEARARAAALLMAAEEVERRAG